MRLRDNYIENAAQGIDIHADHVTITGNMVVNAFVGMKAMHGSRCVLIANNQFSKCSLWAIGLTPGAASKVGNEDGDSIIANNIISEFGYGDAAWMWPMEIYDRTPIRLERGQTKDNPPLRNVTITANTVAATYPTAEDAAESTAPLPPRYKWALRIDTGPGGPDGVITANNQFAPGTDGVRNQ